MKDPNNIIRFFRSGNKKYSYYSLEEFERLNNISLSGLPVTKKILIENILRNGDRKPLELIRGIMEESAGSGRSLEIPFRPSRVILQDFTGVPSMVDLAALRTACVNSNIDPELINPGVPCDLIIDHSIQVDFFGSETALQKNMKLEMERNFERYHFLKWSQAAFPNLRVFPPGAGIVHQINLEYLADCITLKDGLLFPDTLVGTDSHTTMINALGIVGWGVGGIEAEAVMLGQPVFIVPPPVLGFELKGKLGKDITATDLVLNVTELLRDKGVVGHFVEFFGEGLNSLSLPDRAVVSNMAPEYGATVGFFPFDETLLEYLRMTGRKQSHIDIVEKYTKEQGLWRYDNYPPKFKEYVSLDISTIEPCISGPGRPQDKVTLSGLRDHWEDQISNNFNIPDGDRRAGIRDSDDYFVLTDGSVVIAAITSCTNTSNPELLVTAGLLAKNAFEKGLRSKPWVKTSFAPGSRIVEDYLKKGKLLPYLEKLGFNIVGFGCTTCIGNSGPLPDQIVEAINSIDLIAVSVLSGNRNFEGRINPDTKASYLASPPIVVAFALAGNININFKTDPIGTGKDGENIYLKDIWPEKSQVSELVRSSLNPSQFNKIYDNLDSVSQDWNSIKINKTEIFDWPEDSTYIRLPHFLENISPSPESLNDIKGARILVKSGDFVTTDHISPAGVIPDGPAADYLKMHGVKRGEFNTFGSRRGNPEVMSRGTFANIRLRNEIAPGKNGGWTTYLPENKLMYIWDAAMKYAEDGIPLIVIAGKGYGMGSSRDWAAKGTFMLGVKAVIAESFERIHRSNLIGMGVLPLEFLPGENRNSLLIEGSEVFNVSLSDIMNPGAKLEVRIEDTRGKNISTFSVLSRIDTKNEYEYYLNGGILQTVFNGLRKKNNC